MLRNILYTAILVFSCSIFLVLLLSNHPENEGDKQSPASQNTSLSPFELRVKNVILGLYGLDSTGHFITDPQLAEKATHEIITIGEPAIPFLMEAMKKEDGGACGTVASVLSKMGEPGVTALLQAAANKWRPLTETVRELGKFNDKRAIPAFLDILDDTSLSFDARAEAGVGLSRMGDSTAVLVLLRMLESKESRFYDVARHNVVIAIGKIGDERAVYQVIDIMHHDEDGFVRQTAAEALGSIGSRTAVLALEQALEDSDKYVRAAAAWALKQITGKDYSYKDPPKYFPPNSRK